MHCIYCGTALSENDKFCPKCGRPTTWRNAMGPSQTTETRAPEPQSQEPQAQEPQAQPDTAPTGPDVPLPPATVPLASEATNPAPPDARPASSLADSMSAQQPLAPVAPTSDDAATSQQEAPTMPGIIPPASPTTPDKQGTMPPTTPSAAAMPDAQETMPSLMPTTAAATGSLPPATPTTPTTPGTPDAYQPSTPSVSPTSYAPSSYAPYTPSASYAPSTPSTNLPPVIPPATGTAEATRTGTSTRTKVWAVILSVVIGLLLAAAIIVAILVGTGTIGPRARSTASTSTSQSSSSPRGKAKKDRSPKKSGPKSDRTDQDEEDGPSQNPEEITSAANSGDFSPIAGTYCSENDSSNCLTLDGSGHITGSGVNTFSGPSHDVDSTVSAGANNVFTASSGSPETMMVLNPSASEVVCHHSDSSTTAGKQCVTDNANGAVKLPQIDKPDYFLYFFRDPSMTREQYLSAYQGLAMDGASVQPGDSDMPDGRRPFIVAEPSFYGARYRTASEVFYLRR